MAAWLTENRVPSVRKTGLGVLCTGESLVILRLDWQRTYTMWKNVDFLVGSLNTVG